MNSLLLGDASRIAAAIPSGVGFLGAGLIFKMEDKESESMVVHGLTTAASVWLSAAVGIACGGELYFAASFGVAIMMLLLRFGPRSDHSGGDDEEERSRDGGAPVDGGLGGNASSTSGFNSLMPFQPTLSPNKDVGIQEGDEESQSVGESVPLMTFSERQRRGTSRSIRKRASLASMV
jgi:MgtC family